MASLVPEINWSCMNTDMIHDFAGASKMSSAVLMSLLEETQGDQDHDEERLTSLIRALEVELDPTTSEDHHIFMDSPNQEDLQMFDMGYVAGGGDDFPAETNATPGGFGWVDMEIGSSQGSTDDQSVDWYMDSCLDETECKTSTFEEHGNYQNMWQKDMY